MYVAREPTFPEIMFACSNPARAPDQSKREVAERHNLGAGLGL